MKPFLVLDANAFIHISDFSKLDEIYQFYSTLDALSEVKDYNARERLRTFPYKINQRSASDSSVKLIRRFAQETGDLASLSNVDIDLIALAYTLIEENGKVSLIRPHPPKPIEFNKIKNKFSEVKN
jgi:RNA-binding protein NOB1